jgi:deoxyribose-phosphate aldolase
VNKIIDQTFLKPNATSKEFSVFCEEAARYRFICVAVLPNYVKEAVGFLRGTGVHVMAAMSYPRGQVPVEVKRSEILEALSLGAEEIDMVLDLFAIKIGKYETIEREIRMLRELTAAYTGKAILETSLLSDVEIIRVCEIASEIGIDFVKSSTGFDGQKASLHAVQLMRRSVSGRTRVKAAGGIGSLERALQMIQGGAQRIGTSAGPLLVEQLKQSGLSLQQLMERLPQ